MTYSNNDQELARKIRALIGLENCGVHIAPLLKRIENEELKKQLQSELKDPIGLFRNS